MAFNEEALGPDMPNNDVQDAARYRWLRDKSLGQFVHPIVVEQRRAPFDTMQYIGPLCGKNLDKAVDAAIAALSAAERGSRDG